jgi:hypothetical protein
MEDIRTIRAKLTLRRLISRNLKIEGNILLWKFLFYRKILFFSNFSGKENARSQGFAPEEENHCQGLPPRGRKNPGRPSL